MFDYKLIEALAMVVREGGFEKAARVLLLTQSAVSQRVRQLEERSGQILLSRTSPPQVTEAGRHYLKHYRQVKLLEDNLVREGATGQTPAATKVAIAVNADSLSSWFFSAVEPLLKAGDILFDIRVDDQAQTHRMLKDGEVIGCVSTLSEPLQGCRIVYLGRMDYRLVATTDFISRWFPTGLNQTACTTAPGLVFNLKDQLHDLFFKEVMGWQNQEFSFHQIPSPDVFLKVISEGLAYGMLPDWQCTAKIKAGDLVELVPGRSIPIQLYWHCWNLDSDLLEKTSRQLVKSCGELLAGQNDS